MSLSAAPPALAREITEETLHERPESGGHCYVKQQPETPEELEHMLMAIRCAEIGCIRYRGHDQLVQLRIVELGEGSVCDSLPEDLRQRHTEIQRERERERSTIIGRILDWLMRWA